MAQTSCKLMETTSEESIWLGKFGSSDVITSTGSFLQSSKHPLDSVRASLRHRNISEPSARGMLAETGMAKYGRAELLFIMRMLRLYHSRVLFGSWMHRMGFVLIRNDLRKLANSKLLWKPEQSLETYVVPKSRLKRPLDELQLH